MVTETLAIPKEVVLRFIVESASSIQTSEESQEIPLVSLSSRMCYIWNRQIAFNLTEAFPDIKVALINDADAKANLSGKLGHTIGIGMYKGELFAYDASIAQQGGKHEKRPVRIWQGSSESLQTQFIDTFGGSWKIINTAVDFLTGKSDLPGVQVPYFHTHDSVEW